MVVLLPDSRLGLRRRIEEVTRNSHGERVAAGWGPLVDTPRGPLPDGRANERADGTWAMGLDPALWPVRTGDLVIADTGESWTVMSSDLITNSFDDTVDWVRVTAQKRSNGGTEPGGAWFVARFTDTAEPGVPDPNGTPILSSPGLWVGYGPPPTEDWGALPGDEYVDLETGTVYSMQEVS